MKADCAEDMILWFISIYCPNFQFFLRLFQIYHNLLYMHVCEKENALKEYYVLLFQ